MEPPSVARAEALWLLGRSGEVVPSTQATFELALEKESWWIVGELACWRRRSEAEEEIPEVPEPWAAESRRRLAPGSRALGSPRRSVRGCPGASGGGRRGGARGCSRAPPKARCPTGCRGRRTTSEKTGRSQPSARPPAGDAGQSCRAHFTGARGARACRKGPSEWRDCRPACPLQTTATITSRRSSGSSGTQREARRLPPHVALVCLKIERACVNIGTFADFALTAAP